MTLVSDAGVCAHHAGLAAAAYVLRPVDRSCAYRRSWQIPGEMCCTTTAEMIALVEGLALAGSLYPGVTIDLYTDSLTAIETFAGRGKLSRMTEDRLGTLHRGEWLIERYGLKVRWNHIKAHNGFGTPLTADHNWADAACSAQIALARARAAQLAT